MLRTGCLLAPQRDFVVTLRRSGLPYRRPPATALLGHYAGQTLTGKFITAFRTHTTTASDSLPTPHPLPGSSPVIGRRSSTDTAIGFGRGGPPQFPPPPSERSTPSTPDSPSRLHLQDLHRFHGLHRDSRGSALSYPLTTRQASLHAADRSVAPTTVAFDAGLRPGPFPDRAASLLPGFLATTRTGLTPAGDDELPIRS